MRTLTITEALVELKLYDSKIRKKIDNVTWCDIVKKESDSMGNMTSKSDFTKKVKADYESITALIEERKKIKSAVVQSNAKTEIVVGDTTMTVAEAIERKNSIVYEQMMLEEMTEAYEICRGRVAEQNRVIEMRATEIMEASVGKEVSKSKEAEEIYKAYIKANEMEIIDPIGLDEERSKKQSIIDDFLSNVDTALSISNATTTITI